MDSPLIIATFPKSGREAVQLSLQEFAGRRRVDLRITAELTTTSGIMVPTKKGVGLEIGHLPGLIAALIQADFKAREMGWLGLSGGE